MSSATPTCAASLGLPAALSWERAWDAGFRQPWDLVEGTQCLRATGRSEEGMNERIRSGLFSGFAPGSRGRGVFVSGSHFTPPKGPGRILTCYLEGGD